MHAALGQDTKTTKVATKKSQSLKQQPSQSLECVVILELKVFACSVGEPTEVLFSLYDREKSRSITEEFCVDHTAQVSVYSLRFTCRESQITLMLGGWCNRACRAMLIRLETSRLYSLACLKKILM